MKRRYIAAIAVFVPTIIAFTLNRFYPNTYEWLDAYMIGVAIAFKGALLSFWVASKLKLIAFFKSLTLLNATIILVKRWFLDNVFAKWLEKNLFNPLKDTIIAMLKYYKSLNLRTKIKNLLIPLLTISAFGYIAYHSGYLDNLLLFTELKIFIIGLSKSALSVATHIVSFILDSWITPILEVFALSLILTWLEDKLGSQNPLIKFINAIGNIINYIVNLFVKLDSKLDGYINKPISNRAKYISLKLNRYINSKKIAYEYSQFERLERKIMSAHIDSYFSFKGMDKIKDKKELYKLINKKSKDNLNIVAYISRNSKGELLDEWVEDSFYHDIFILEGVASSQKDGITKELPNKPDFSDFWVLNTSNFSVTISSKSGIFETKEIAANSLVLIDAKELPNYSSSDIVFKFNGVNKSTTAIT